jgi:hypothetical protein
MAAAVPAVATLLLPVTAAAQEQQPPRLRAGPLAGFSVRRDAPLESEDRPPST